MTGAGLPPSAGPAGELPPGVYRRMANVLRVGLSLAFGLLAVSLVALVARSPTSASGRWIATNPLVADLGLRALGQGLAAGSPVAYLTLGVYALIATPVVRVATGSAAFFRHGERKMAELTAVVLVLLLVGLLVLGPLVR
jgi:uncharacterized membrane protein